MSFHSTNSKSLSFLQKWESKDVERREKMKKFFESVKFMVRRYIFRYLFYIILRGGKWFITEVNIWLSFLHKIAYIKWTLFRESEIVNNMTKKTKKNP